MKKNRIFILICFVFVIYSCSNEIEKKVDNNNEKTENLIEEPDLTQVEKYPNGQIKTIGEIDEQGRRNGVWISYFENGTKWSETNFLNGKRNGHSIVFYPNGRVWYFGDYSNDKKSGEWVFYKEDGSISKKESY